MLIRAAFIFSLSSVEQQVSTGMYRPDYGYINFEYGIEKYHFSFRLKFFLAYTFITNKCMDNEMFYFHPL